MRGKMPVTTASLIKFNKTCESVSQNIEKPESPEEVRAFCVIIIAMVSYKEVQYA